MPYIITTIPAPGAFHDDGSPVFETRTAVATLEEAEHDVELMIEDHGGSIDEWPDIPEAGGTVGPLPDGTVIEVAQRSYAELRAIANILGGLSESDQIAAFNLSHSQHATA